MAREVIFRGRKIRLEIEKLKLPDGKTTTKEIVVHPGAAVMIPFVDSERICMVKNKRIAVGKTLLELPAGTIDPGESPRATALREIEEETGYRARRCRKIAEFYPSPGILSELMHLYVMEDLEKGESNLDAGEQLEPIIVPWKKAVSMALRGEIKDGKTLVGLLLYNHARLTATQRGAR